MDLVVDTRIVKMKTLGYIANNRGISLENYGYGKMLNDWMFLKVSKVLVEIISWMDKLAVFFYLDSLLFLFGFLVLSLDEHRSVELEKIYKGNCGDVWSLQEYKLV